MLIKVHPTSPLSNGPDGPVMNPPLLHTWADALIAEAISRRPGGVNPAVDPVTTRRWRTTPVASSEPLTIEVNPTDCAHAQAELIDPLYAWPMWGEVLLHDLIDAGYDREIIEETISPVDYEQARSTAHDPAAVAAWVRTGLPAGLLDELIRFFHSDLDAYLQTWTHLPDGELNPGGDVRTPAATRVIKGVH